MASRIVQYFADKLRTVKEYPITLTKAVYNEDGERLDNTLSKMGEYVDTGDMSTVSVPSSTFTTIGSITLHKGVWVVESYLIFDKNETGLRGLILNGKESAISPNETRNAVSGGNTIISYIRVFNISTEITMYLRAIQKSGSDINCTGRLRAVCIK